MRNIRLEQLEAYIIEQKNVSLDTLCQTFGVSMNTIRRDLSELTSRGTIKKVYGGVTAVTEASPLISYEVRNTCLSEEKDIICRQAASYVKPGDIIYLDTGTTCLNLIDYLCGLSCTILTNSLQVCIKAAAYPSLRLICLPGELKRETLSFVGEEVLSFLKIYNIQKAFMTATGLSTENGLSNASPEEYRIKCAVMNASKEHYLLLDHSKFDRVSLMTYASFDQIHCLITDQKPSEKYLRSCENDGIQLVYPEVDKVITCK